MPAPDALEPAPPPTGTVTFLFSHIEGSTRLLQELGERYAETLRLHREAMRRAFVEHDGAERGTEGDSFFVAFGDATNAVSAAAAATRGLAVIAWPEDRTVRVRIGIHTGEAPLVGDDYIGMDVHRAARIAAAAHGGQVLLSQSTRILVERSLPAGVRLRDLGEHRLKDLAAPEHLYQLDVDGLPAEFPPLRSLARVVANLPSQLPTIVGRETEIAAVTELLARSRLVTVTGPGGTGKTRLAQEVALQVVGSGASDVAFVPLEALTDASLIPGEIIRALRLDIPAARDPLDRLVDHLAGRPTLLVLDNLEQLHGAGLVVRQLLDRCPTASVLVSSQAAVHVAGELEYALGPLAVPGPDTARSTAGPPQADAFGRFADNAAVRLFVERAAAVRAGFTLDPDNARAIAAIASRLDGLPLAIELAAAQVKMLSPDAILDRMTDRLDTLSSRRDDVPERQRTLRATVAWSYDLLDAPQQRLFRRLSAFSGGARLAEVERMAAAEPPIPDAIGALETLVDRSLVSVRHPAGGDDRFMLLHALRAYGRELLRELGEADAVFRRHAEIYSELARHAEPEFYRSSRRTWLGRLADDHDNLRAALDELEDAGDLAGAMALAADLWRFWQQRGHLVEGRARIDGLRAAAERDGGPAVDAFTRSRLEEAAGSVRYWMAPDRTEVQPLYERSVELARESGNRGREAWAMYNLAFVHDFVVSGMGEPDPARATELRTAALGIFRELGDQRGVGESLWAMGGNMLAIRSDPARARRMLEEAIPLLEGQGDQYALGWANLSLGMLNMSEGHLDAAEEQVLRAADLFQRDGDAQGEILAVQALGSLAARRGDDVGAIRLDGAAAAAGRAIGVESPRIPPIHDPIEAALARVPPEGLQRERDIGVAIGAEAMLRTALQTWRAGGRGEQRGATG